ncbi:hypothetical protein Leryth_010005 [Lithospermum erythrorhizon]|nr:hypothetical protein Leryth_010005 [Lithospermum erythrorhizon]
MEISYGIIIVSLCCSVFFLIQAWKFLNFAWLKPKKLEKCLRDQGLKGNSYKVLYGDLKEMTKMIQEAKSKPMSFSNDIVPRVLPQIAETIKKYGKSSYLWFGPRPAVILLEPELIREVMSKSYIYQKVKGNPLTKMLAQGLASQETEKWAKHRRLITPAFHQEKLKGMLPAFYLSSCEMLAKWEKEVSTQESCELDVWPYLQTLTSDAISRTAFGSNYEEGRKIFELQIEQAEFIMQLVRSIYIPGWRYIITSM